MLLQIYFEIEPAKSADFEKMYKDVYVPAMRKQQGYLGSKLLRIFPPAISEAIQAAPTEFNYQMELMFDTEENRMKWVASPEHVEAWAAAEALFRRATWRGYDVAGDDMPCEPS
jgi:antibiotic biosynthesis monooxygenase (ABM) superfamily enzyme